MTLYTLCIYNEDDENNIINFKYKEDAINNFNEYLDDYIGDELAGIEESLVDIEFIIKEYGKDLIGQWQDYYYEMMPKYLTAKLSLKEYLKNNSLHQIHTDFGYIFENEVE